MEKKKEPLLAKFEIQLPDIISEEEFNSKITGTGPKFTATGGDGIRSDVAVDADIDHH